MTLLTPEKLAAVFADFESTNLSGVPVDEVHLAPRTFQDFRTTEWAMQLNSGHFDWCKLPPGRLPSGMKGTLWGANIFVDGALPDGAVFLRCTTAGIGKTYNLQTIKPKVGRPHPRTAPIADIVRDTQKWKARRDRVLTVLRKYTESSGDPTDERIGRILERIR